MEPLQKAIIVGVKLQHQEDFETSLIELADLAAACDVEVVGEVVQKLDHIQASHYIGKGKVKEVLRQIDEKEANLVIFNDELSPTQIRNLEADLDCKVIDRTILILDIFAQRAKTKEAQLQVAVAQLQYMLPRLVGLRKSLGRQSGGVGTRNKGIGEKKLELDRRKIEEQIDRLNKELRLLVSQRQTQRKQRKKSGIPIVSLVGYTNAGKSTIMNAIVEQSQHIPAKQVFEKDMLFATLETTIRKIQLPDQKSFLLTDTVGFVNKLPHHLVKAFRSTLEEVKEADLLLHVVDFSNPNYKQMMEVTDQVLKEIGVENIPVIYVYNKADLIDFSIPLVEQSAVTLSAQKRIGITDLLQMIRKEVFKDYQQYEMLIPYSQNHLLAYLKSKATILSTEYEENGAKVIAECRQADIEKYLPYVVQESHM
ncbi:GTPase HflX [Shimazuella sp. AN120528]|uniref:GTPase HflX n=1 Tax=Shimazuella soli TaxID=1892854 RepID=UPI001F11673E|nr:GTPase HflX [Shimazuella soli]MCH5586190.1 GTPase HflX [Shimazuella soli]